MIYQSKTKWTLGKSDFPKNNRNRYRTENAALAGGAPCIVSQTTEPACYETKVVPTIIASGTCLSSKENCPKNKGFLKPEEGIEPSRHKMTTLVSHQASGWRGIYQSAFNKAKIKSP